LFYYKADIFCAAAEAGFAAAAGFMASSWRGIFFESIAPLLAY